MSIQELVDTIQANYRTILSPYDYEIIEKYILPKNYTEKKLNEAISIAKSQCKDSLKYLVAILNNMPKNTMEAWQEKLESTKNDKLSKEDYEYAVDFYRRYCDTEEEFRKKIKELREV